MKSFSLGFILLTGSFVFAATEENIVVMPKTNEQVYQGSSAFHRIDKKFQVTYQPLGATSNNAGETGLSFGYFIDRDSMILVNATSGQNKISSRTESSDGARSSSEERFSSQSLGVSYKRFFANSFYARSGLDQRRTNADYSYSGFLFLPAESASFTVNTTSLSLAIGNQWQWENFTLGCDWFGLSQPLMHSFSNESVSDQPQSIYADQVKRDKKQYGEQLAGMFLQVYLGATF